MLTFIYLQLRGIFFLKTELQTQLQIIITLKQVTITLKPKQYMLKFVGSNGSYSSQKHSSGRCSVKMVF